jgi:site-specific DNA-methyltransferase (adenine-specific)
MNSGNAEAAEMLRSMRAFLKENDMMAYLAMMAVRLLELHRVLKPTGSLYLHCDPSASHYLKILMDAVFGAAHFQNEIIWKRTSAHSSAKRYGPVHDVILFYSRSDSFTWNPQYIAHADEYLDSHYRSSDATGRRFTLSDLTASGVRHGSSGEAWRGFDPASKGNHWKFTIENLERLDTEGRLYWPKGGGWPRYIRYLDEVKGVPMQDVWVDLDAINAKAQERLGYPTQKPQALLERIITASSNEGEMILDPFCGCGTTIHAAQKLKRRWIGIDITHLAIWLIEKRLKDAFPGIEYEVHGTPKDLDGARDLAFRNKHEFQLWAGSRVNAVPFRGGKKGADTGIDGLIYFKPEGKATEKAVVSVKGGENVGVAMVRDLAHVVDREKAKIGVFITLAEPSGPMKTEAVKAGFYETLYGTYPKIQILTIAELFDGNQPNIPLVDSSAFRKAAREKVGDQDALPF